jgi:hypothetical protein
MRSFIARPVAFHAELFSPPYLAFPMFDGNSRSINQTSRIISSPASVARMSGAKSGASLAARSRVLLCSMRATRRRLLPRSSDKPRSKTARRGGRRRSRRGRRETAPRRPPECRSIADCRRRFVDRRAAAAARACCREERQGVSGGLPSSRVRPSLHARRCFNFRSAASYQFYG